MEVDRFLNTPPIQRQISTLPASSLKVCLQCLRLHSSFQMSLELEESHASLHPLFWHSVVCDCLNGPWLWQSGWRCALTAWRRWRCAQLHHRSSSSSDQLAWGEMHKESMDKIDQHICRSHFPAFLFHIDNQRVPRMISFKNKDNKICFALVFSSKNIFCKFFV